MRIQYGNNPSFAGSSEAKLGSSPKRGDMVDFELYGSFI